MKKISVIIIVLFFLVTPSYAGSSLTQVVVISAEELQKMVDDGAHFTLIDTRYDKPYWEGHLKNAVNLPSESVDFQTLEQVAPDMNYKLVFYCDNNDCPTAKIAANKAIGAGYKYVYLYSGGYEDWSKHGYTVVK